MDFEEGQGDSVPVPFGGSRVWVKRYNLYYFLEVEYLDTWLQIHILMGKTE